MAEILGLGSGGAKEPELEPEARKVVELYGLASKVVTWEEPDGDKQTVRRTETRFSRKVALAALPLFRPRDPLWTLHHALMVHQVLSGASFEFKLPEWLSKKRGGDKPDWWRRRLRRLGGRVL